MEGDSLTTYRPAAEAIKTAILQGQYEAAQGVNRIQLAVYFAIGRYVSQNTRRGVWGTGALEAISQILRRELPGLKGFSANSLKNMRKFYESWHLLDPDSSVVGNGSDQSTIAIVDSPKHKIDFVVPWVDSSDPAWIELYNQYRPDKPITDRGRFRNWDIFRYWFRAVEQYAPWVNKVFLVTNGTFPKWINPECPKLVLVNHKDYIPEKFLPTFNSVTIELNMDKIPGLSEHFVYFNDDFYLNAPVRPEDYFRDGLPCDCNEETLFINPWYDPLDRFNIKITIFCDMALVNSHFNRWNTVKQAPRKWFGPHLWGKSFLSSLMQTGMENFEFFRWRHWEQPMLKSVIQEVWEKEPKIMEESCSRFRKEVTLNQYIFRYWQFASNRFCPTKMKSGSCFCLSKGSVKEICRILEEGKVKSLCLNDSPYCTDEDGVEIERALIETFEKKFPNKSMFES